jgi:hypothetical protein
MIWLLVSMDVPNQGEDVEIRHDARVAGVLVGQAPKDPQADQRSLGSVRKQSFSYVELR